MIRYLPIALGVVLIVGLTIPQIVMTDRLSGSNVSAEQMAELLTKVPTEIGDWHGEDQKIEDIVRQKAGAVGAISRVYRNVRTGETVDLWLIVGHAKVITGHTPDICYPSSGFETRAAENSVYPLSIAGQPAATFLTNTFFRNDVTGRHLVRVFWAWYDSTVDEDRSNIEWEGPTNPRYRFGNSRALYKMYFTAEMPDGMETAEQSVCLRFAREFLPAVNKALADVQTEDESGNVASADVAGATESAAADATTDETSAPAETDDESTEEPAASTNETAEDIFGGTPAAP